MREIEARSMEIARKGRKPPKKRKMTVVKLGGYDVKADSGKRRGSHVKLADRSPMRGDRIGHSEDAVWLNVGRVVGESIAEKARREEGN